MAKFQPGDVVNVKYDWEDNFEEMVVENHIEQYVYMVEGTSFADCFCTKVGQLSKDDFFSLRQEKLLAKLPLEFRSSISYRAWEQSHAYGYDEVISTLAKLVDCLVEPIADYTKRIVSDSKYRIM